MVWMHEALWKEQHEFNMRVRDIHVRKRVSSRPMSLLDICSESNLQQIKFDVASKCWKAEVEE
jgi:hypothetical protein